MSRTVNLAAYDNSWYRPGASGLKRIFWYLVNGIFFRSYWFPFYGIKRLLLRLFGAKIGKSVVIKPRVSIKYPWKLAIGDYSWVGEGVWIDNLAQVTIGPHACLSQGVYLVCGNHNYQKPGFDLMVATIDLAEGVWIGAGAMVLPGVRARSHAVLTAGSVIAGELEAFGIYAGNPATRVKQRIIEKGGDA